MDRRTLRGKFCATIRLVSDRTRRRSMELSILSVRDRRVFAGSDRLQNFQVYSFKQLAFILRLCRDSRRARRLSAAIPGRPSIFVSGHFCCRAADDIRINQKLVGRSVPGRYVVSALPGPLADSVAVVQSAFNNSDSGICRVRRPARCVR